MHKFVKRTPVVTQADKIKERSKAINGNKLMKKEAEIDNMSAESILAELKNKGLQVFGTAYERKERLKRYYGISSYPSFSAAGEPRNENVPPEVPVTKIQKKSNVVEKIEEMKHKREERRKRMEEEKRHKLEKEAENMAVGKTGDVDFELMIEKYRLGADCMRPHLAPDSLKINVCVRKRPLFKKEMQGGEIDCVSVANPRILVHECKFKVDGITKYLDNQEFNFDNVFCALISITKTGQSFSEGENTEGLYTYSIKPLIPLLLQKGVVTCFAYGQTGSGKTFTMKGVQQSAIEDLFSFAHQVSHECPLTLSVSFFEIYGGHLFDLLNNRNKLNLLEDKNQKVQIQGLVEHPIDSSEDMLKVIEYGHGVRTTHATTSNDTSSRSHAICQIMVRLPTGEVLGKLSLVDLAVRFAHYTQPTQGSERAQDCQSNNKQRRLEGAEINKSLLALKECIRAIDSKGTHIPFRASKLTMVLRDSFIGHSKNIRIVMIACVSPGKTSADHTINTLRYADRLKEKAGGEYGSGGKAREEVKTIEEREEPMLDVGGDFDDVGDEGMAEEKRKVENAWLGAKKSVHEDKQHFCLISQNSNEEAVHLQEKADKIIEEEEELFKTHMAYLKEDAQLLTEEGKLINNLQRTPTYQSSYSGRNGGAKHR
eukprot:TRINITY_DN515_c0_g1_i1.p1 TRINITY_DN515_c0_g1~~TRINITY_DN515_c0_g1_i1.p1  ORF type:complete len:654 (-),score=68.82 TRINITY_DN515_c0_g1_i1:250-2211(-)